MFYMTAKSHVTCKLQLYGAMLLIRTAVYAPPRLKLLKCVTGHSQTGDEGPRRKSSAASEARFTLCVLSAPCGRIYGLS